MFAGDADADGWTAELLSNHVCTSTVGAPSTTRWQDGLRILQTLLLLRSRHKGTERDAD